ncbi:MAG TPA: spore coat protein U domain-containing protein [Ramlibacter sp.]|nr:spore coat protein U domain-containing protein [Ramlibacter sp.]
MKKLSLIAAATLLASGAAFATDLPASFNVSVSVTPICSIKTNALDIDFGTYTPFTNAAVNVNTHFVTFQCSHGLAPNVAFDTANGTTSASGTGAATAEGLLSGLRYTLAIPDVATALGAGSAGTVATAGAGGTGGNNSVAKEYKFTISASMAANQAGATVASSSAVTHQRQIILTY